MHSFDFSYYNISIIFISLFSNLESSVGWCSEQTLPAHNFAKVQYTSSSQLMHLQSFTSDSDTREAGSLYAVSIAVTPFPNPFNAMTAAAATLSNPLVSVITNQIAPTMGLQITGLFLIFAQGPLHKRQPVLLF